jgi:hypothetical protein
MKNLSQNWWLYLILQNFTRLLLNCEKRLLASSCPSVRTERRGSHLMDFHEILYLNIFRKSVEKIKVLLKFCKDNRYLTWRSIYILLPNLAQLVRNISDKSCTEHKNTSLCSTAFYLWKSCRLCRKILYSQTGHRWRYNTAHALCMPDN